MSAKSLLVAFAAAGSLISAVAAEPPADPPKQRQVCRTPAKQLGSRIRPQRRCRTVEQWQAEEEGKSGLPLGAQVTEGQNDGIVGPPPR
jgi:hypothetical protein